MSPPLLMDSTEKCMMHFSETFPTDRTRPLLAEFCGVEKRTPSDWLHGRNLPAGETLIKLRIFLSLVGYRVAELDNLSDSFRQLAHVIAVVERFSPDEVRQRLDYRNVQDVYRLVLRGNAGTLMENRLEKLKLLLEEAADELKMKLAMWRARIQEVIGDVSTTATNPSPGYRGSSSLERHLVPKSAATVATPALPEVVDHLVRALTTLFDGLYDQMDGEFEVFDEQRRQVRDQVGSERLRKLIDQLDMLS